MGRVGNDVFVDWELECWGNLDAPRVDGDEPKSFVIDSRALDVNADLMDLRIQGHLLWL